MDTRTTPARSLARTIGVRGLALGLLVLAPGLIGCSTGGDRAAATDGIEAVDQTAATGVDVADPVGPTPAPSDDAGLVGDETVGVPGSSTPGGTSPDAGNAGGGSGGNPSNPTPQPVAAAPVITSFETPESIDCHNGDFQEFTARWTTTGATKVTISIDGPGIYAEYAANGEASLPFSCTSAHSFLLTAYGSDGQTATSTVTLQPRNVQVPEAEQVDDES